MLFILNNISAKSPHHPKWHRMAQPVKIKVRHIDFYIFPNGDFDFNAHGRRYKHAGHRGVRIEKDRFGKIRRVGNVYINYNRYGQVSRIGRIFIKYNRRGLVVKVGPKYIRYHRRGYYVYLHPNRYKPGFVINSHIYYGPERYDNEDLLEMADNGSDNWEEDDNYYFKPKPQQKPMNDRYNYSRR